MCQQSVEKQACKKGWSCCYFCQYPNISTLVFKDWLLWTLKRRLSVSLENRVADVSTECSSRLMTSAMLFSELSWLTFSSFMQKPTEKPLKVLWTLETKMAQHWLTLSLLFVIQVKVQSELSHKMVPLILKSQEQQSDHIVETVLDV